VLGRQDPRLDLLHRFFKREQPGSRGRDARSLGGRRRRDDRRRRRLNRRVLVRLRHFHGFVLGFLLFLNDELVAEGMARAGGRGLTTAGVLTSSLTATTTLARGAAPTWRRSLLRWRVGWGVGAWSLGRHRVRGRFEIAL